MKKAFSGILAAIMLFAAIVSLAGMTVFAAEEYEILTDGTVEDENYEVWLPYNGGVVDFYSEGAHDGEICLIITERTHVLT